MQQVATFFEMSIPMTFMLTFENNKPRFSGVEIGCFSLTLETATAVASTLKKPIKRRAIEYASKSELS
jgi:hypothetical protein